jgi:hypothetical protein
MTGSSRTLLGSALALLAAPALAQVNAHVDANLGAQAQVPTPTTPTSTPPSPTLPTQAADRATQAVGTAAQDNARTENTAQNAAQATTQRATRATTEAARQDTSATAKGATHAAANASVAQRDLWARLDADHDGRISLAEADSDDAFGLKFGDLDTDDDGFVSQVEYGAYAKAETSQGAEHAAPQSAVVTRETFMTLDADRDGRISSTEAGADAGFDGSFNAMDGNGDGFVTDAEFRAHAKATSQPNDNRTTRQARRGR